MSQFADYPIVLIPGIARFDYLRTSFVERINELFEPDIESDLTHYFKGIRSFLRSRGYNVEYGDNAFADGLEKRADELERSIFAVLADYDQPKVHLLGHSMGGLDARHVVATRPFVADKVATVTTLGTPHLGLNYVDEILEGGADDWIDFAEKLDLDFTGFRTLTKEEMSRFNAEKLQQEATNDVIYTTYAAWQNPGDMIAPMRISWDWINREDGENDGLVSVVSQRWHSELKVEGVDPKPIRQRDFAVQVDHLNQTGRWDLAEWTWTKPNFFKHIRAFEQEIKDGYLKIVQDICSMGI